VEEGERRGKKEERKGRNCSLLLSSRVLERVFESLEM